MSERATPGGNGRVGHSVAVATGGPRIGLEVDLFTDSQIGDD